MICAREATKRFGPRSAVEGATCRIPPGCMYGLVGSNGAGKSTLLRLLAGIYRPDAGAVTWDDTPLYDHTAAKRHIAYVGDELYAVPGATLRRMAQAYRAVYPAFDTEKLVHLTAHLGLDSRRPMSTFSKGVKRQAALVLALSCGADYLLLDETFDGLDPVVRREVKALLYDALCTRGLTVVAASHSLRELEDICDHLAFMHEGRLVLHSEADTLRQELSKVQVAFADGEEMALDGLDIVRQQRQGSVVHLIVRGPRKEIVECLSARRPLLLDVLPLSLEEAFICQLEACGYTFAAPDEAGEEACHA